MRRGLIGILLSLHLLSYPTQAAFNVQEVPLKQGVTARLVEDHSLPIVSIVLLLQGGDIYDPLNLPFLSGAVMDLLGEGTQGLTGEALKEILLDKGIQLSFTPTGAFFQIGRRETLTIQLRTTTSRLAEALTLLHSIFLTPRFDKADLKEWALRTNALLVNMKKDPGFIAENTLRSLVYGDTSWGVSYLNDASPSKLETITPVDVQMQWARFLTCDRLKIGVCGDISAQVLSLYLENLLEGVPTGSSLPSLVAPPFPSEGVRHVVPTTHPQAVVEIAHPGVSRSNPDYPAFALMTHILAGGMSSRLFKEIREKQGLVYGISALPLERQSGSILFFSFESKNDQVPQAVAELQAQLLLLKEKGVTKQELQDAKTSLLGSQDRGYASTLSVAHRLALSNHLGEPKTFYEDFKQAIDKTTLADINYFIKNFLEPHRLQTVIVGKITADQFKPERTHAYSTTDSVGLPTAAVSLPKSKKLVERS